MDGSSREPAGFDQTNLLPKPPALRWSAFGIVIVASILCCPCEKKSEGLPRLGRKGSVRELRGKAVPPSRRSWALTVDFRNRADLVSVEAGLVAPAGSRLLLVAEATPAFKAPLF